MAIHSACKIVVSKVIIKDKKKTYRSSAVALEPVHLLLSLLLLVVVVVVIVVVVVVVVAVVVVVVVVVDY